MSSLNEKIEPTPPKPARLKKVIPRSPRISVFQGLQLILSVMFSIFVSLFLSQWGVPAAFLLTGVVVGLFFNLVRKKPLQFPSRTNAVISSLLGVLLGTYLDAESVRHMDIDILFVSILSCSTIVLGVFFARIMVAKGQLDPKSATLGLLPGGSAGVITAAIEINASTGIVAFMQYTRSLLVSLTAPIIFTLMNGSNGGATHTHSHATMNIFSHYFRFVNGHNQLQGSCIAVTIALVGYLVGKKFNIPSGSLLCPLFISTIVSVSGITDGFGPAGVTRDILFTLIGMEVGLKFTREAITQAARLIHVIIFYILLMCIFVGVLSYVFALILHQSPSDVYLATTPGGINSVLAAAQTENTNKALITVAQCSRLILSLALLPILIKLSRKYDKQVEQNNQHAC